MGICVTTTTSRRARPLMGSSSTPSHLGFHKTINVQQMALGFPRDGLEARLHDKVAAARHDAELLAEVPRNRLRAARRERVLSRHVTL